MRKESPFTCHNMFEECDREIHLLYRVDGNTIFIFHYSDTSQLSQHLVSNGWNSEMVSQLLINEVYVDGNGCVEIEIRPKRG